MGYQALLFCPDDKTARAVTQVLNELDFSVEPCTEPFAAVKRLMAQHFDAVVVDCDNEQNATLLFKSARNSSSNQSSLAVAVVEGQAGVAKAFRIGANLVLTKPINIEQAKGTLRVARGLLRKGADPTKPAAAQPAAPAPPAPSAGPQPLRPIVPSQAPKSAYTPAAPTKAPVSIPPIAARAQAARSEDSAPVEESAAATTHADAAAKPSVSSAPKKNYPWQPVKSSAEPMASALKKAAEAAGIAETVEPKASTTSGPPSLEKPSAGAAYGAASAPAPAREKAPAEVPLITPASQAERSTPVLPKEPAHLEEPSSAVEPPSFSMGAPAYDEEEPANNKKALIIVGVVVLLAALAGFLGWKNMSGKSAPSNSPAPATEPASTGGTTTPDASNSSASAPAETAKENASRATAAAAPSVSKPSPSTKPAAHEPVASKPEPPSEQDPAEAETPAFVVRNEQPRVAKKSAQDSEPAVAPSAIGVASATDSNALAAISSAPVNVPKPSTDVVKVSQGVSEGLVLKRVAPKYPMQAIQMRKEGLVQLQATITKTGSITNLKVLGGDPTLAKAAVDAVRQWKYKPYYLDGEPVDIQTQISVNFKLPQ